MTQITFEQALDLAWQRYEAGRLQEAESICRQILQVNPNYPDAVQMLGLIAHAVQRYDLAIQLLTRSIELVPQEGKFYHNLAETLAASGKHNEAIASYCRAIELGNYPQSWSHMGNVLLHIGRGREAIEAHRNAVALEPDSAKIRCNFGVALQGHGKVAEAIEQFQESLRLDPTLKGPHSNALYAMHYTRDASPEKVFEAHRQWAKQHAAHVPVKRDHLNVRNPERKLRIGFVSADLINHPVGRFMLPLFQLRDAEQFDFIGFSGAANEDQTTLELRKHASGWHQTAHLNDEQLAALVVKESVDILVDLSGHTSGNVLLTFARKPAPVQVTYLGYPNTTGLEAVDYRITDEWADPIGETDSRHTEKLVRLPRCFLCFAAPDNSPPIAPLPAEENGRVTFGSFNYFAKISPEIAEIWRRVLEAIPNSQLVIKSRHLEDIATREDAFETLVAVKLPRDRVTILRREPNPAMHLATYRTIDIALDTFPYHGTTTTCEALWMGVPVITLAGDTHVSRVGVSLLNAGGAPNLIAQSVDKYIELARDLANDRERLKVFRATARERMLASPLMDAQGYARDMYNAFRSMWRTWCTRA